MATHPQPYVRLPLAAHKNTLILLHGTSQTGAKFAESFLPALFSPPASSPPISTSSVAHEKISFPGFFPTCKFVFPTGAARSTTVFGGRETNAWFDLSDFGDRTKGEMDMLEGMRESSLYLAGLIQQEAELLDGQIAECDERPGSVVIMGFSQGSAMGLILLLGGELQHRGLVKRLGAFVGLSGWLPFRRQIEEIFLKVSVGLSSASETAAVRNATTSYVRELIGLECADNKWISGSESLSVPVFLGHGKLDVKMKFEWGLQLKNTLKQLGMDVEFKSYAGLEHWWSEKEMIDVAGFLSQTWQTNK
ncbi:hypothetical protein ONS95_011039 [Cadophora gregata]|uniref:uncharacterized protein n=1 Tax=Cadophora gregata TaxID=51156 RepID=UPI0026DCFC4E|nr:uncharacterized protein ONS95_011039 [Cadophora gregata]KAK0119599.1 hypothetical protein ONS95_011039 [Cadophora gregata]KAK0120635.1 hypothetical protein ONS96_010839 [Cadophora gregata f. sp. sojae]